MPKHSFKTPGILRSGFEYQDLIGIELLIGFFRDPTKYLWVELESENESVGYLDDVVAARSDGSFEVNQVKFTINTSKYFLDWNWLLEKRPNGTSFLKKWSESIKRVAELGPIHSAQLRTNRRPNEEFEKALNGHNIDPSLIGEKRRRIIETELGGSRHAAEFFAQFQFSHSEPLIDQLENQLKGSVVPTDTDSAGWLLLREQARRWATRKLTPQPDGRITHQHLVQIITKKRAQPIPQDFQIPAVYCPPSDHFHAAFISRIANAAIPISILWGTPGRGKSTYLSFVIEELKQSETPTIRHHYFLSLDDTTSDRFSFSDIATSLMNQMVGRYPGAVKGLKESSDQLRKWVETCGSHFAKEGKHFVVVVDGLDHVWRESTNTAQMEQLFNYLLPCPPNVTLVVGTQKVPDNQLPHRLIQNASEDDWIEIPAMDEGAVQAWVAGQHEAGRVRLRDNPLHAASENEELGAIGAAFFEISQGHPLHLIYSFEALVRRGAIFTPDQIRSLPACPDGDIRKYYRGLWRHLSPNAKQIIHLIAGSDFHWPSAGIRQCVGPIDEIDHLLEHRRSGLIPFHGSILAFAREIPDHDASFRSLLPKVLAWLEHDAGEYWRWGWLWLMRAKSGDYVDLLSNTTRAWVVGSLARGWPEKQIVATLAEAERKAFEDLDYSRTIELRSLKTRVQNGPEYQMDSFAEFQECAVRLAGNIQQVLNLADGIATLTEMQILSLARTTSEETPDVLIECVAELRRRVNLWLSMRHRPAQEFIDLTEHFMEVWSLAPTISLKSMLEFVEGFPEPNQIFSFLVACLSREMRLSELTELAESLKSPKKRQWLMLTQNAMVRVAAAEGANITSRYHPTQSSVSALMSCWLHYHTASTKTPVIVPEIPQDIVRDNYSYGRNNDLEAFFQDIFFYALAVALKGQKKRSLIPVSMREKKSGWIYCAANMLEETARMISNGTAQLAFSTPYYAAREIEPVTRVNSFDASYKQCSAFKHALRQIAINLHCLKSPVGKTPLLTLEELSTARSSAHWSEESWIADQVEHRLVILNPEAAKQTLESAISFEAARISEFNERADKWTELARFALLYEIPHADQLVSRAANCIVGYGWRKDLWIIDVLDAIGAVHEHRAADGLPWLRMLVPIVEKITEFTDGDETDHARSELIDVIAKVSPDHLQDFYAHHIAEDEFRYAEDALSAHCKLIDFSDPVSIALAHTFVERTDIATLESLREMGDADAAQVELDQIGFLGGVPPDRGLRASNNNELEKRGTPPDITRFGPSDFLALVERTSDHTLGYEHQREALKRWLYHWREKGKGVDVIASVRAYFDREENPYFAESLLDDVFQLSLELEGKKGAYPWLVLAHVHHHGWQSYWTSEDEVLRRLGWAAEHYKNRWAEFISDSSKPSRYWQQRRGSFVIGTKYLVHFLLLVDQKKLAARFTDSCVRIVTEEVSDQPIPDCPWFR